MIDIEKSNKMLDRDDIYFEANVLKRLLQSMFILAIRATLGRYEDRHPKLSIANPRSNGARAIARASDQAPPS